GMAGGAFVDHQAATRQDAFTVRLDDRAVDGFGIAEIVAIDDKRGRRPWGSQMEITAHLQTLTGRCSAKASSDAHFTALRSSSCNISDSSIPAMISATSSGTAPNRTSRISVILTRNVSSAPITWPSCIASRSHVTYCLSIS